MKIVMIGANGFVGVRLFGLLGKEPQKYSCRHEVPRILQIDYILCVGNFGNFAVE